MKALTLHQPWASLIATGAKTLETRSWPTRYRGPLAIHAAKTAVGGAVGDYYVEPWFDDVRHVDDCYCEPDGITPEYSRGARRSWVLTANGRPLLWQLPLGAIVATCQLVDAVPMVGPNDALPADYDRGLIVTEDALVLFGPNDWWGDKPSEERVVTDQRPYGDFTPGRWAWLLADVKPVDPPVPARGSQGLWEWEQ